MSIIYDRERRPVTQEMFDHIEACLARAERWRDYYRAQWLGGMAGPTPEAPPDSAPAVAPDPAYGSEAWMFRELMAVMHGDGGHYHAQHGAKKAYEDAVAKYYRLVSAADIASLNMEPCPDGSRVLCVADQPEDAGK